VSASRQDQRATLTARTGAPRSHVLLYFVLAYAISWAWVIPLAATGHTVAQGRGWPTHLPSLVGPMVAALLVTGWDAGGPGVRDLLARMARWRIGWRWWVAAVSPLLVFLAVLVVLAMAGEARAHGRPAQRRRPAQIRIQRPGRPVLPMTADRCLVI
jgi:CAAX protease family protein